MGLLYDKQDLAWNTEYWNRMEMHLHKDIANGLMPASTLEATITYASSRKPLPGWPNGKPDRHVRYKDVFELERKRERMKLLRTGQLLHELGIWRKRFLACKDCYSTKTPEGKNRDVACDEHNEGLSRAKSDVYWAGRHNEEERASRGQRRNELALPTQEASVPHTPGANELNKWETLYQRDKAEGAWPLTPGEQRLYDVENSYRGFLNKLLQDEEMSETEYLGELQRLRNEQRSSSDSTKAVAGTNAKPRKDTRYGPPGEWRRVQIT
jgi:hypothetical protein